MVFGVKDKEMILLAIFLPCVYFLFTGRLIKAIVSFVLMITGLGWPIASIWALTVRADAKRNAGFNKLAAIAAAK